MRALIEANPLAVFVTARGGLSASHIPMVWGGCLQGRLLLRGHLARGNPQREAIVSRGSDALAVFSGPHAYISPEHYPTKAKTGRVVPTWNYAAVHASGTARIVEDAAWLDAMLEALTAAMEKDRPNPWKPSDAPDDYRAAMRRGIVGLELEVARLEGKWKMSQDKKPADRDGAAEGLRAEGAESVADLIEMLAPKP